MTDFRIIQEPRKEALSQPLDLSLVVPTSNTAAYIDACLNSITVQGDLSIQLIVVDYKSVDGTLDKVRAFGEAHPEMPLTIVEQIRPGLGDARNFGATLAKGEFFASLDSDDFFGPHVYAEMVSLARAEGCDLVFCRGQVFHHDTALAYPFYDNWVWDRVMGKNPCVVTSLRRSPVLLSLEPNANIRIFRRAFLEANDLHYPEGKRCEDVVPHYRALYEARRIGAVSSIGYFYRVGRPGKLTENAADWVFDGLDAMATALIEAGRYQPTEQEGGFMVYLFERFIFGYGCTIPYAKRTAYFERACLLFYQIPRAWRGAALFDSLRDDIRAKVALHALCRFDVKTLLFWSSSPKSFAALCVWFALRPSFWRLLLSHVLRHKTSLFALPRTLNSLRKARHV